MKSRIFYRKMGFEPSGEEFIEAGITHINILKFIIIIDINKKTIIINSRFEYILKT